MKDTCRYCANIRFIRTVDGAISESQKCILDGYHIINPDHRCKRWEACEEGDSRIIIHDKYTTNGYPSLNMR